MKQLLKELKYSLYLIRHPFNGFWDIKYEKYGSMRTAVVIMILTIATQILSKLYTGYLFGGVKTAHYNMFSTVVTFVVIFFAWCISNWCLTCLSDGKGTFKDICMATAYSLVPYTIIQLIMIVLSNVFVLREQVFYNMLNGISLAWTGFLLLIGMLVTHHYTLKRTLVVILFTLIGMLMIGVLALLFFNLVQQVLSFVTILIEEITLRFTY